MDRGTVSRLRCEAKVDPKAKTGTNNVESTHRIVDGPAGSRM